MRGVLGAGARLVLGACGLWLALAGAACAASSAERARWYRHAVAVRIVRDEWGIAHVHGRSDADAVFGAMYAQAEDDFARIEHNYLASLGRRATAEGERALYADLRVRLFIDPPRLQAWYRHSPPWLRALMQAWADGLNFYLARHREVVSLIAHYEPWMALSFTEGSIGADIESIDLEALARFYAPAKPDSVGLSAIAGARTLAALERAAPASAGSNGFAIAPARSASGHALLWINPHTSFYFRTEMQISSDTGLDVYGALTWGQFFVYQGFNARNGWMHTSYGGDAVDEYAEDVVRLGRGRLGYRYADGVRPLNAERIHIEVRAGAQRTARSFTVYRTHHGPIVRSEAGRWIAVKLLEDPVHALEQSFLRTTTRDYAAFMRIQDMRTDTSNNTLYADADGTIAYFHGNFIPRRDPRFDYTRPLPGEDPATEWHGAHALEETIHVRDPPNGWLQNTNDWPFSVAGAASPRREDYPRYMWTRGENARGRHAVEVLEKLEGATLETLIAAGYDSHLTEFDALLPPLLAAYDRLAASDARRAALAAPIASLRGWDHRAGVDSSPSSLAIFWGQVLIERREAAARGARVSVMETLENGLSDEERLAALGEARTRLEHDFGRLDTAWGEINRFQRLDDTLDGPHFDDAAPSWPVGFAPSKWGSLAAFEGPPQRSTRRIYGTTGNSFVAAVEFGPTVRAQAVLVGGESGHPDSAHFIDQAQRYCEGRLREVHFSAEDVLAHARRQYHPGEP